MFKHSLRGANMIRPRFLHVTRPSLWFALAFLILSPTLARAQGDLLITPKRVIFGNTTKSAELNLANTGTDTATYLISFIQLRMKANGELEKIELPDSAQNFADKYLRLFPRSVKLGPNEAQTIKLQITRKNEMAPGEYRSHLYFRAVPNEKPLGEKEPEKDAISVRLVPVFGISIPIIIRIGESSTTVNFTELAFKMGNDTVPSLKMTFNRKGNMSVYGDIAVDHISMQGKKTRVGAVKGLAVYAPNSIRQFTLPLNKLAKVNYSSGTLHLVYSDQSVRPLILAEEDIPLGRLITTTK